MREKTFEERFVDLQKENISMKHQVGGYKVQIARYKEKIEMLSASLEHYKGVDKEGDELYEEKIAECESLAKQLEATRSLYDDVCVKYSDAKGDLIRSVEKYNQLLALPWYKRLFCWGKYKAKEYVNE